jgi:pSer/pThr/pTyr-binding forkhead associated (FHA) protein
MIGILQIIQGPDQGKTIILSNRPQTIGRAPSTDIVLNDIQVSRTHCELSWEGERFAVKDAGSRTGTWVNGEKLSAPRELQPGDVLAIGQSHLQFQWSREDEKPTTAWNPVP